MAEPSVETAYSVVPQAMNLLTAVSGRPTRSSAKRKLELEPEKEDVDIKFDEQPTKRQRHSLRTNAGKTHIISTQAEILPSISAANNEGQPKIKHEPIGTIEKLSNDSKSKSEEDTAQHQSDNLQPVNIVNVKAENIELMEKDSRVLLGTDEQKNVEGSTKKRSNKAAKLTDSVEVPRDAAFSQEERPTHQQILSAESTLSYAAGISGVEPKRRSPRQKSKRISYEEVEADPDNSPELLPSEVLLQNAHISMTEAYENSNKSKETYDKPTRRRREETLVRNSISSEHNSGKDSSLGVTAKKFVELLKLTENGEVDLNVAANRLDVQKRRIYDITNVLEGVGLIKKTSKSTVTWRGNSGTPQQEDSKQQKQEMQSLIEEIEELRQEEELIERKTEELKERLRRQSEQELYKRHAYVSHEDIRMIPNLARETILAIKAPPSTRLEVPNPDEQTDAIRKYEILLFSEKQPIDVYLIENPEALSIQEPPDTPQDHVDPENSNLLISPEPGLGNSSNLYPTTPLSQNSASRRMDAIINTIQETPSSSSKPNDSTNRGIDPNLSSLNPNSITPLMTNLYTNTSFESNFNATTQYTPNTNNFDLFRSPVVKTGGLFGLDTPNVGHGNSSGSNNSSGSGIGLSLLNRPISTPPSTSSQTNHPNGAKLHSSRLLDNSDTSPFISKQLKDNHPELTNIGEASSSYTPYVFSLADGEEGISDLYGQDFEELPK